MRTASNYFVVSMAVGDILVTVVLMLGTIVSVAYASSGPFSGVLASIMCELHYYIWFLSTAWSTLSLSAIAVDRFLLVFFPHRRIITLRIARLSIKMMATIVVILFMMCWLPATSMVSVCISSDKLSIKKQRTSNERNPKNPESVYGIWYQFTSAFTPTS